MRIHTDRQEMIMNTLDKIVDYEDGLMDQAEVIDFFQELITSGLAWTLQGTYGRIAESLIRAGWCEPSE